MKIGDKVRFLNATGGGIVKGFQGKDIAIVEDDGFDTPVLICECVVIQPANEAQVRQSVKPAAQVVQLTAEKVVEEKVEVKETKGGDRITVCLAFLPIDIKSLNSTGYECYLVNDSNYFLAYTYMYRTADGWVAQATGEIEPNTKIFIEEFGKADLNDRERICLQFVSYKKDKPFDLKNPCSVDMRIDTVKFYKLHSFRENDFFDDDAIIYYVMRRDLPERELVVSPQELEQAMREKDRSEQRTKQPAKKSTKHLPVIEVDLHINELLDSTAGLSAKDILDYQIETFRRYMDENKNNKGQKIVFIHGKGDGVLKSAIMKDLKDRYKNVYYQDASFKEYGFGATMITFK
ncbi:hypothetical protein M2132_001895 [Dysgonomonas sp. PH5-45]|uniref:DUF2027 domain-containing protein n=1 Tax=unclassified Dysgonomonas TaxID=2630389 RepID=UPI0024757915|nr:MULTISPECIES: DUF2027 domain-containing protein [unclassified Dysgonomonas]MDH6355550.1 hypothetical protein [Dysgonomonas sp. PH5-45]MDH6388447.1 hypothetical protein [Dysgonomonas sp. PH5-37]